MLATIFRYFKRMDSFRRILLAILVLMLVHYLSLLDYIHSGGEFKGISNSNLPSKSILPVGTIEKPDSGRGGKQSKLQKQISTMIEFLPLTYEKYSKNNLSSSISSSSLVSKEVEGTFLFCSVYMGGSSAINHEMIESLLYLQNGLIPHKVIILVFANSMSTYSKTLAEENRNVFILDSKKCKMMSMMKVDCMMKSAFSASKQFFRDNSIQPSTDSVLFLFTNSNSNEYFTPSFIPSISFLLNKYNASDLAVIGLDFIVSDRLGGVIREKVPPSFSKGGGGEDAYKAIDDLISANVRGTEVANRSSILNPERTCFLVFSERNYPVQFPSYLLSRDSIWCQHLANHFNKLDSSLSLSFIDVSSSVHLINANPKKADDFEPADQESQLANTKLYQEFFQEKATFNQIGQIKLMLKGCPESCYVSSIVDRYDFKTVSETLKAVKQVNKGNYKNVLVTLIGVCETTFKNVLNWKCWADSAGYSSYIFITEFDYIAKKLREFGQIVVLIPPSESFYSHVISPSMSDNDRLSVLLGEIHLICVQNKIRAMAMSPYLLLVNDLSSNFVSGISDSCDVILLMEALEALAYIKPNVAGEFLLRTLIDYRNVYPTKIKSDISKGTLNYDLYKNIFVVKSKQFVDFKICKFSRGNIVNSDFYFRNPLKRFGNAPFAFNLNVPDTKFLNVWDESTQKCTYPNTMPLTDYNERVSWTLRIRVLTSYRTRALERLLNSMVNADYDSAGYLPPIPLDIVVDFPNISTSDSEYQQAIENNQKVRDLVNSFSWSRGPINITIHERTHGIVHAWLNSRLKANELLMVLEDDIELSSFYYKYLVKSINHFYVNPENYNPLAVGLSSQRQYHIVGETIFSYYDPYGPKIIDMTLGKHSLYYKYQLISSWGPVLFPKPWNEFIDWVDEKVRAHHTIQCVPFLFSNKWALSGNVWTPFASRFIFEKGLFMIYLHSPNNSAFVTNHKEPGLHFTNKSTKEGIIPLIESEQDYKFLVDRLPPQKSMRLFDFHFREVSSEKSLILRNKFIDHGLNSCITISRSKAKDKKKTSKKRTSSKGRSF